MNIQKIISGATMLLCFAASPAYSQKFDEWLVLGPIAVTVDSAENVPEEIQVKAFETDYLHAAELVAAQRGQTVSIENKNYEWKAVPSTGASVNLDEIFNHADYSAAYAWNVIESDQEKKLLLGVGSDDGIRIWINGELVHNRWIGRALTPDEDLVPVTLRKGTNQILLKVQDLQMDWGFSCRVLPAEAYSQRLITAAMQGQMDDINLLISHGGDINAANPGGMTALHAASIGGRREVKELLLKQGADPSVKMPPKEKLADALFESIISEGHPGAAVLVSKDGNTIYKKGFGKANIAGNLSITPAFHFRIGSITKQFTAAAILKLQEEGKISVNDKLSRFLPDYPRGSEVTIHHLLTHTSGIKSYTDKINFQSVETTLPIESAEKHIASFRDDPYNFNPGDSWSYNNSGYFLLGYIIEKISGMSYAEYLENNFFKPLGMNNTGVHYGGINLENEALGYSFVNGKVEPAPDWEMSWAGGAGALYSTVDDLFLWNEAVFNGKVLSDQSLASAFTPVQLNDGTQAVARYGYGWMLGDFRGWDNVFHGGGLPGYMSFLVRFPEQNITVAILSNFAPPEKLNPQQAAFDLAQVLFWEDMEEQESFITVADADPSGYQAFAGRYEYPGGAVLEVVVKNDQLFAQLTGQSQFEIFPRGNDEFFWKIVDAQVKFVKDEAGMVVKAIHTQGGQTFEAPKLNEESAIEVDPLILKSYTGEYDLNGTPVNILMEGTQLFIQVNGQPRVEIYPKTETEFFLKAVSAHISFLTESGKAIKFILSQGGVNYTVVRK